MIMQQADTWEVIKDGIRGPLLVLDISSATADLPAYSAWLQFSGLCYVTVCIVVLVRSRGRSWVCFHATAGPDPPSTAPGANLWSSFVIVTLQWNERISLSSYSNIPPISLIGHTHVSLTFMTASILPFSHIWELLCYPQHMWMQGPCIAILDTEISLHVCMTWLPVSNQPMHAGSMPSV